MILDAPVPLRVAFAGGGTGGHIYPALAIDEALRSAWASGRYEPHFFGNRTGLEARLVTAIPLTFVPSAPLQRRPSLRALRTLALNVVGLLVAAYALLKSPPTLVIATGGYVCFPVVAAARLLRLLRVGAARIALLEMNAQPGLTNRLLAPLVDEVWITHPHSRRYFGGAHLIVTGVPVRAALQGQTDAALARRALGLDPRRLTIVIFGGSQGARSVNEAVAELVAMATFPTHWQVAHVCGERDFHTTAAREAAAIAAQVVRLIPYLDDPGDAYAAADIVVSRAGASTLAELSVTGTPAILIPYPFAAEHHQAANAHAFAATGAAVVLADADLTAQTLLENLHACLAPDMMTRMRAAARSTSRARAADAIVMRAAALVGARVLDAVDSNEVAREPGR